MSASTATVHNPTHFDPADYSVEEYLDNRRPEYCGQSVEEWQAEMQAWEDAMHEALGPDWMRKCHRCVHCGNTSIRWITAVAHAPTGETVVFGAVCTARLGFADKHAFKLAQLQARAEARKVRFTIWNKRQEFLAANPAIADALARIDDPIHERNTFAKDVLSKLDTYGELSPKQTAAVVASLERDKVWAARKAQEALEPKGDAPTGRVEVAGTVVSLKLQESLYGSTLKMLVKLDNAAKVWCSVPSGHEPAVGDTVAFKATFTVSDTDKSFAFGKRPVWL